MTKTELFKSFGLDIQTDSNNNITYLGGTPPSNILDILIEFADFILTKTDNLSYTEHQLLYNLFINDLNKLIDIK